MDKSLSRRSFAKTAAAGAAGLVALRGATAEAKPAAHVPDNVHVCDLAQLQVGSPVEFEYPPGHPAVAVRIVGPALGGVGPDQDVVAFHRACPHMGCPLPIDKVERLAKGEFGPCFCHRSSFDIRNGGRQICGRASQDAVQVRLAVVQGGVYAVGKEGLPFGDPLTEAVV